MGEMYSKPGSNLPQSHANNVNGSQGIRTREGANPNVNVTNNDHLSNIVFEALSRFQSGSQMHANSMQSGSRAPSSPEQLYSPTFFSRNSRPVDPSSASAPMHSRESTSGIKMKFHGLDGLNNVCFCHQ